MWLLNTSGCRGGNQLAGMRPVRDLGWGGQVAMWGGRVARWGGQVARWGGRVARCGLDTFLSGLDTAAGQWSCVWSGVAVSGVSGVTTSSLQFSNTASGERRLLESSEDNTSKPQGKHQRMKS